MNIDARLEALTQSLELLVGLHRDLEAQVAERFSQTDARIGKVLDVVERLAGIVESHERRLDGLEDR